MTTPKNTSIEVTMEQDKETLNMIRFKEIGKPAKVGTVYLSKTELASLGDPELIKVRITPC